MNPQTEDQFVTGAKILETFWKQQFRLIRRQDITSDLWCLGYFAGSAWTLAEKLNIQKEEIFAFIDICCAVAFGLEESKPIHQEIRALLDAEVKNDAFVTGAGAGVLDIQKSSKPTLPLGNSLAKRCREIWEDALDHHVCDICGTQLPRPGVVFLQPKPLVDATVNGFVPTQLPSNWESECTALGISIASHWKTVVRANSEVDWGLCRRCSDEVEAYLRNSK